MNKYIIYIIIVLCQYIMDRSTSNCSTYTGEILLLFHHFYSIYLYLGAFFFDPFIHLIVASMTIIHWYTYDKCILTEYSNIYCDVNTNRPFYDYVKLLKIHEIIPNIHWILLLTLIFYDICLIID
jgi:hypothetical protein